MYETLQILSKIVVVVRLLPYYCCCYYYYYYSQTQQDVLSQDYVTNKLGITLKKVG